MTITLVNTDSLAWLREQPDGAFDLCITDPPFDERTHAGARTKRGGAWHNEIDFAPISPETFVPEMLRVTRRWVICFCALEQLGEYQRVAANSYRRSCVWVKTNSGPQITGDRPAQNCEGVALMHRSGNIYWKGGGVALQLIGPNSRIEKQNFGLEHPTVKPLWLMRTLVDLFAAPGDHILDPFMGSGTTGVAAIERGHPFTGLELDPRYFAEAQGRVANVTAQPRLAMTVKAKQPMLTL